MNPFNQFGRSKHRFVLNEKSLVLLLILISIITIFIILFNLPNDLSPRVAIDRADIKKVLVPDVRPPLDNRRPPNIHGDDHQHPAPPMFDKEKGQIGDSLPDDAAGAEEKRERIRKMALLGWSNYEKYAWGENELRPLSKIGHSANIFGSRQTKLGATIVDGLDTMFIMGFNEEYKRGRDWIVQNLDLNIDADVSAFEINIRFIGGLLSLYTLTKDKAFLTKAEDIAKLLLPIFDTPTGIPYALVNPKTKVCKNYNWASGSCSILAEFGTLSLEFQYLSDMTGNKIYEDKIMKIQTYLDSVEKENGLYYNYLSPHTGKWCLKHTCIGALADSFYEYLFKLWMYNRKKESNPRYNATEQRARNKQTISMYLNTMKAMREQLVSVSPGSKLTFISELKSGRIEKKMDHLACFSGGLFGMTATYVDTLDEAERAAYMDLAKGITNTCHESYVRTPTHLGPEAFHFERDDQEAMAIKQNEKYYILRPEVVESYFYMWRLTKEQKYRDWAWDAVLALEKHCRAENGYSGVKDVYEPGTATKDDVQQSFFFAETLKYLFLIFSDDSVFPLDKYVFNTEAHPFLIDA